MSSKPGERPFADSPFSLEDARTVWDKELFQGVCGALTRCPNGDFLTAFMKRTDAMVDNATYFLRSKDEGATWEKEDLILRTEREEGSLHVAQGLTTTKSGKLLMPFIDVSSGRSSPDEHPRYIKLKLRQKDLKMMVSEDNGHTWSDRYLIDPEGKWGRSNYPYGRIIEMDDGELLLPLTGPKGKLNDEDFNTYAIPRGPGKAPHPSMGEKEYSWTPDLRFIDRAMLLRSRDGGRTWPEGTVVADHPMVAFHEMSLSVCRDGSMVALMRTARDAGGFLWQTRSEDGGKTWVDLKPSGLLGQCMYVHTLPSGRVIAVYRKMEQLWDDTRAGMGLSWSDDNGKTWQGEITLKDPKGRRYESPHETGMPAVLDLDDGRFFILFYSYDPDLPFEYTTEPDPEPWKEIWYVWKRYIASNVLKEK